jgi:hypothetical protein
MSISVGRFRPIATGSIGALTSDPLVPVKRTVGFVVVDMALAALAAARIAPHTFIAGIARWAALTLKCKQVADLYSGTTLRCARWLRAAV